MTEAPRSLDVADMLQEHRELAGRLDIFLNGEIVHRVRSYDLDKGEVVRIVTDASGAMVLNEARDGVKEETLHGKVAVRLRASTNA